MLCEGGGHKDVNTSMLPLMENSRRLLRPSGETERISILVFLPIIRFKSPGAVKLPWEVVVCKTTEKYISVLFQSHRVTDIDRSWVLGCDDIIVRHFHPFSSLQPPR